MNDTISTILTIIGSYGFPIAITVYLLWERYTIMQKVLDSITNMDKSLEKSTLVIQTLTDFLKGGEK